jgi:WD40 repeat protein
VDCGANQNGRDRSDSEILPTHQEGVDVPSIDPEKGRIGMLFITGSYDGTCKLWNARTGECIQTYEATSKYSNESIKVTCIAYLGTEKATASPNKNQDHFIGGYKSGKVRMWDMWSGICLAVYDGHIGYVHSICAMKDSCQFASASGDTTIKVWTASLGNSVDPSGGGDANNSHKDTVSVDASIDGDTKSDTSSYQSPIKVADITFVGHAGAVLSVACVSKSILLTGSDDKTARLWSVDTGACFRVFVGHTGAVTTVAVVDNITFLTGSKDTTIKVWDGLSASCIRTYTGHTGAVTSVSTTLQSGTFISASEDRTVKLWIFTAVLPVVNSEDGGTLNEILGFDDTLACVTCENNSDGVDP